MMLGRTAASNIANMNVGRETKGGRAIMLMSVDGAVGKEVLDELEGGEELPTRPGLFTLGHMKKPRVTGEPLRKPLFRPPGRS